MRNLNRRKLIKMGMSATAVAFIGGASPTSFVETKEALAESMQHDPMKTPPFIRPLEPEDPREWQPSIKDMPAGNSVKLIFSGLMGFCPNQESGKPVHCDVGIHSVGDSAHHHRLSVTAYQIDAQTPCVKKLNIHDLEYTQIDLTVEKPLQTLEGVAFYQPTPNVTSRRDLMDQDFRWIIDFESNYLYLKHLQSQGLTQLQKNKNVYKTMFKITNGVFYTLRKTASAFRVQTKVGDHHAHLGSVADVIGANIYLENDGKIVLTVKGNPSVELTAPAEVYFYNHCMKDLHDRCDAEPYNLNDKKKRSDFFLNYKAFQLSGMKEYELFMTESKKQTDYPNVLCERTQFGSTRFTDEAPCSGTGYGGGGGLLPFP